MTKQEFKQLTETLTYLDGATGSNLMAAGMPRGTCTEEWIYNNPDMLVDLQKQYVQAGSQIIYAPTFGANRINLTKHHLEDKLEELNTGLVKLSREAAQVNCFVAGDVTTTGEMLEPFGDMTYEEAYDAYKEQITCLCNAGIDLLVIETMFSVEETCAAIDAAHEVCDLPVLCSMTVNADGSFFTGSNIFEASNTLEAAGADAIGLNCSVGPEQLVSIIRTLSQQQTVPIIAKPNAGMPTINSAGNAIYDMTPADFARHMKVLVESGARLIGGCCGTTPAFIHELKTLLG